MRDSEGLTAFEAALQEPGENDYVVEAFLDSYAILPPDALQTAVLSCAGDEENASIVELVLSRGAMLETPLMEKEDDDGFTALHMSALKGALQAARVILRHPGGSDMLQLRDDEGRTPLHDAASAGNLKMVRLFLESGADMNACGKDGRSSLGEAITHGHEALASVLLSQGAGITIRCGGHAGGTVLHFAVSKNPRVSRSMLAFLLSADREEEEEDEPERFPLLHEPLVLNATDTHGDTALHLAAHFGDFPGIFSLIDTGAMIVVKNSDGYTPIEMAKQRLQVLQSAFESEHATLVRSLEKCIVHLERVSN